MSIGISPFVPSSCSLTISPATNQIGTTSVTREEAAPAPASDSICLENEAPCFQNKAGIFQAVLPQSSCECFETAPTDLQSSQDLPSGPNTCQATSEAKLPDQATDAETAAYCNNVALSGKPMEERIGLITSALSEAVAKTTDTPNSEWEKASPQQLKLYVQETLEHTDALRQIGTLRGLDFTTHDLEPQTGKFEPRLAQYMALPGRGENVSWAIAEHNASPHHATWKNPDADKDSLAESASDIVNAWRMERRVYDKPSWSWERIGSVIDQQFQYNELSVAQRDALFEAMPFQMESEQAQA